MSDDDIKKIAQIVYDMMYNDLQQLKQEMEQAICNTQSVLINEISNQSNRTRSDIHNIEGQMYNLRRV